MKKETAPIFFKGYLCWKIALAVIFGFSCNLINPKDHRWKVSFLLF